MQLRSILCLLLNTTTLIAVVNSQIPLPKRPLGFVYKGGEPSAPIHLTAFVDLTCPDSQQAWPTVKKVLQKRLRNFRRGREPSGIPARPHNV